MNRRIYNIILWLALAGMASGCLAMDKKPFGEKGETVIQEILKQVDQLDNTTVNKEIGYSKGTILHIMLSNYNYDKVDSYGLLFAHATKKLIKRGVKINHQDIYGRTALYIAAGHGYFEVVKILVANGANANLKGKERIGEEAAPLRIAIENKVNKKLIKFLAKESNKEVLNETYCRDNVLHLACKWGKFSFVKYLVEKRHLNINKDGFSGTPIELALACGHIDIVKYLEKKGAKLNVNKEMSINCGSDGFLSLAVMRNDLISVAFILDRNAKINARNNLGMTAMDWCKEKELHQMAEFLSANKEKRNKMLKLSNKHNTLVCAICLRKLRKEKGERSCLIENNFEELVTTPCQHIFHKKCLLKCFDVNEQCPMCREKVNKESFNKS